MGIILGYSNIMGLSENRVKIHLHMEISMGTWWKRSTFGYDEFKENPYNNEM